MFQMASIPTPACTRYDSTGEQDERVLVAFAYALGMLGNHDWARRLAPEFVHLHDHKGDLYVVYKDSVPEQFKQALQACWADFWGESESTVHFCQEHDDDWLRVFAAKRW